MVLLPTSLWRRLRSKRNTVCADGIADSPYRPNDLIDTVLWTAPQAKILVNSPAVQTIRWAQTQFPALLPGGVVDSHPLMQPPRKEQP